MHEALQHICNLLFACVSVAGNRHFYLHRRVLIHRQVFAQCCRYCHALRMNNFYHCLWILVHKLRLYRQEGRVLTGNDVLKEEKLLLQTRILPI